jgi:DNA-binding NarL/FixJ family response regulator
LDYIDAAVSFLERPGEVYANATDEIRRLMNQALFRRLYVQADEVTGAELNAPFDALLAADVAFQQKSTPADGEGASMPKESREILNIALDDVSSKRNMVGLVQWYSNKSSRASYLRKLAAAGPGRRPDARRSLPRKARQLTDDEKMAFVEGYERGEPIADLATKLGVHRTTLDTLIKRLELTREDRDTVPPVIKDAIVASYRAGETLATIASRHSFSPNKVQRLLVAVGEPIRSRGPKGPRLTSEQVRELVDRYERGSAVGSIAEELGVSYAYVRKQLIGAGVQLRPRGGAR